MADIRNRKSPQLPFSSNRLTQQYTSPDVVVSLTGTSVSVYAGTLSQSIVGPVGKPLYNTMMGPHWDFSSRKLGALASPDLFISLTGQSASYSIGTLGVGSSIGVSGSSVTGSAGTLAPNNSLSTVGQIASFSAGTISASVASDVTVSLTGIEVGLGLGTLSYNSSLSVSGQLGNFASGNLVPSLLVLVSGQAGTWDSGSLSLDRSLLSSGTDITASLGTIGVAGVNDVTVALTGQSVSTATGSISIARGVTLTGQLAQFASTSIGGGIPWSGPKFYVYIVSASGRTQWTGYIPVKYVTLSDTSKINRYDDGGALAVTTLTSVTGLREWVDYKPVVAAGTKDWRYDDTGLIRVVEVI